MSDKPKVKLSEVEPIDLAIGGGLMTGGIVFLVLVLTQGSNSKIIQNIKKEAKYWGSKIL